MKTKQSFVQGSVVGMTADAMEHYNELNPAWNITAKTLFVVTHVARSTKDHPGYDNATGDALYDLKYADSGEDFPCSLYDYELERV